MIIIHSIIVHCGMVINHENISCRTPVKMSHAFQLSLFKCLFLKKGEKMRALLMSKKERDRKVLMMARVV